MNTFISSTKKNTSTAARQATGHDGKTGLQRKSNGRDTESLSHVIAKGTPANSIHPFSTINRKSESSYLSSLVYSPTVQAKLTVGKPDNKLEKEADDTATKVMTCPMPVLQRQEEKEEETAQTKRTSGSLLAYYR